MTQFAKSVLAQIAFPVYLRSMRKCAALIMVFCVVSFAQAQEKRNPAQQEVKAATSPDQVKKRLNQILYWQLADELKLAPKDEKAMVAVIEEMQLRKEAALKARSEAFSKLKVKPDSKEAHAQLRAALTTLGSIDLTEYHELLRILGTETLGRFYLVREKVTEKISHSIRETASKSP